MNMPCHWSIRGLILPATVVALIAGGTTAARAENSSAGDAALFDRLDADRDGTVSADEVDPVHERLFARLLRRADANRDEALSRDEFLAALVPSRPEKPIEAKQPDAYPQADAVRYLLLTMDANRNRSIDADEVPEDFQPVFEALAERLDANKNGTLDQYELSRGAPVLGQLAIRYVGRERIDVAVELKKLEQSQGKAASRFDEQPRPLLENLGDPRQARDIFARLDGNGDRQVEPNEAPEPLQPQLEKFLRFADRDRDGRLSEREFLAGAERLSRFLGPQKAEEMPARKVRPKLEAMQAESTPDEDN